MSYTPPLDAEVTAFKTTALLASGATYTSSVDWDGNVDGYSQVQTEILSSHDGTITINFCEDAAFTDVVRTLSIPYLASSTYQFFAAPAFGNYIEYNFTNTSISAQTDFYYTTKILTTAISPQIITVDGVITPSMVTSLNRSLSVGKTPNGDFHNEHHGGVDNQNSTTTPLGISKTFEGVFSDTQGYTSTSIFVKSDQDSAVGGFQIIHSSDGITDERVIGFTYLTAANPQGLIYLIPASTKYFRLKYINGVVAQTRFTASVKYEADAQQIPTLPVNIPINDNTLANVTKALSVGKRPDDSYHTMRHGGYTFETTTPLASGATFTSDIYSVAAWTQTSVNLRSSEPGLLTVKYFSDAAGTDLIKQQDIPYFTSSGFNYLSAPIHCPFLQYSFTNQGTVTQTDFYLSNKLGITATSGQILGLDQFIDPTMGANLDRSVIAGKNDAGVYNSVALDNQNSLKVDNSNNRFTYDEFPTSELTAISQLTFPYNINTDLCNVEVLGSGTVTQDENLAKISTSSASTATEFAALESVKTITYRAGEGAMCRISARFTDFAPNGATSIQGFGLGDANDGYGWTMVGTSSEVNATYRTNGVQTTVAQSLWNADTMDGSGDANNPSGMLLDPTKGNIYQVSYGSGFGCAYFSIESQATGHLVLVHTMRLSNIRTVPAVYNPTFALRAEVFKDGTADANDYVICVADMSSFTQGKDKITGTLHAFDNSKNVGGTETNVLTIQNKATVFGGTTGNNKVSSIIETISMYNDTNGAAVIRLWEDTTLGGTPSYTDIDTNTSVSSVDVAGTTRTGGKLIWVGGVAQVGGSNTNVADLKIAMRPGKTYTFTAQSEGGSNPISVGVVWVEDF